MAETPQTAFLFDLDGTLVDSVYQHVLAWREALEAGGIRLSVWRIHRRIGMSGGLMVDALLREIGRQVTLEEAEARGRGMTGRPHFAQIMVEKGYVAGFREAFDQYLDESAKGYVFRREPQFDEGVRKIREAGGIASLAHPIRVNGDVPALMPELRDAGLNAIEAYHSDHDENDTGLYLGLAKRYGMLVTGGSDYHGVVKPGVKLGTGYGGNLHVPDDLLDTLRAG